MDKNKKQYTYILIVFLLVFVVSVAYAITSGILTFNGTAYLASIIDLNIKNQTIIDKKATDTIDISVDKHSLVFTINIPEHGSCRIAGFDIKNIGNKTAVLGALSTNEPVSTSGVFVVWPNLNGIKFEPNEEKGPYSIVVCWDIDYPEATEAVNLSATINWSEFIGP